MTAACYPLFHRASAARRAAALRSSAVSFAARALPPLSPPFRPSATAAGSFPASGSNGGASPVASSTTCRASSFGSLGRLRERSGILRAYHAMNVDGESCSEQNDAHHPQLAIDEIHERAAQTGDSRNHPMPQVNPSPVPRPPLTHDKIVAENAARLQTGPLPRRSAPALSCRLRPRRCARVYGRRIS